ASEILGALQTVQAFTHEVDSRVAFDKVTEKSFEVAGQRINTRVLMTMIVIYMIFSGVVGVLWIGVHDIRAGSISAGELAQFVIYAILVATSAAALSEIWGELQRASGATERLVELLQAVDTVTDPIEPVDFPTPVRGQIMFNDVQFSYPARPDKLILNRIKLTIKPGETVALVGPSGAGKTTIIQMILRFYDPCAGQVLLDGADLRSLRQDDFRCQVALVPQEPVVFATSALENIRFGQPTANDAQVEAAAKAAAAHEFIKQLPDGYDSYLGERGVMLSGGQKQRIAIARAILRDAPVLLLDEATSALDAESEQAVKLAVEALSKDRTTIIIAHRLATVKKADRILVMDDGQIVDTGTHDELVNKGGLYAHLAQLQFTDGVAEV
ncbi:MAG: ATP-binding cassette domain-containing protein, partial [Paracoccaceae bacterium]|nr:ATP-binding cassette domain-containing protein [Paracoccaceae bacterium]